jgi:hypothetical protein
MRAALLALVLAVSGCAASRGDVQDIVLEDTWLCRNGKQFVTQNHAALSFLVIAAGGREYIFNPFEIDDDGRAYARRGRVAFDAVYGQDPPHRATATLRGAEGGPYLGCERVSQ